MNHETMQQIKDKYFREPGVNLTRQWGGNNATLQAYFNEQGVTNVTAAEVIAKEPEYTAWRSAIDATMAWEAQMLVTDKDMSREMEDHITDHHAGNAGNAYAQAAYDAKVALRGNKP